ncbi:N5,N10-methylene tetrahydromethanopterin reductase [Alsobacter metallidurans]|uniref:Luciferase-like monooxygenase n=1 Tax=Alsobacter metallidurans TaxID=340221 RepID=A0A917MKB0_9HYPH|nr:LLM class flavin-dependent oxidoreductase [Alsobacter metallidurans]GGH31526.1 N5,N10-methylene tetrahydromethanopterin reductase [Alsobacter metallidurans]
MLPLSILDLSFVTSGASCGQALRNTIDLARMADEAGFTRFWVAEHHNLPSVASPAPEIMIGQIGAVTERIRIGSGGVMLPNHAPLMVAERFRVLEALFPGRIDLGIGRAPGTDPVASYALRRLQGDVQADDFPQRLEELIAFGGAGFPANHPFSRITVMPSDVPLPPILMLGSSDFGGKLAAQLGVGFAFAHHFASHDAADALLTYRARFEPGALAKPHAILATAAICAETDAEAQRLASGADLSALRRARGHYGPLPRPEEAAAETYDAQDLAFIRRNRSRLFVGTPDALRDRLMDLATSVQADEVMLTSAIHDHAARKRSFQLLADAFGLKATSTSAVL